MNTLYFEVSADWMKSCGRGYEARVFKVIKVEDFSLQTPSEFFAKMVTVNRDGYPWCVAVGRGKFITKD